MSSGSPPSISPLVRIDRLGQAAKATVLRSGVTVDLSVTQYDILTGVAAPEALDERVRYEADVAWLKRLGILASDSDAGPVFNVPSTRLFNLPRISKGASGVTDPSPKFIGLPWDLGNDLGGASVGPEVIRSASRAYGVDRLPDGWYSHRLRREFPGFFGEDLGDLGCAIISTYQSIEDSLGRALTEHRLADGSAHPVFLGGDHALTLCVLSALRRRPASLVVMDAHDDFAAFDGQEPSSLNHGNWLRAVVHRGLVTRVLLVGPRGVCPLRRGEELQRAGVRVLTSSECMRQPSRVVSEVDALPDGPVYVSIDIDVLEPALAPATQCPVSCGLTPDVVEDILISISERRGICGLDLMEVSMPRAAHDITGLIASEILLLASHLVGRT